MISVCFLVCFPKAMSDGGVVGWFRRNHGIACMRLLILVFSVLHSRGCCCQVGFFKKVSEVKG